MHIERFSKEAIEMQLEALAALLKDGIDNGASMSYLPPLDLDVSRQFWHDMADGVEDGSQIVLVAVEDRELVGSVQLALAWQPNQPHRAEVQKLMVHSAHRRKGIARRLMEEIEDVARQHRRTLLTLDTLEKSEAYFLYLSIGYQVAGIIPDFALNSVRELKPTVVFYKQLLP